MPLKLGKKPARPGAIRFRLGSYLNAAALPAVPEVFGHESLMASWPMFANDKYGDCVWAGAAHETMLLKREAGRIVTFSDANVLADYAAQMLINVATRKFARSVRLPEGDVPAPAGAGLSKSAVSRRFVALSAARMKEWMACDLSGLDLLVIQIDAIHMDDDLILVAAIGVDAKGDKHPLGLAEGATENAATVQALIDNLVERGLDPAVPRLFIIDGAKALSKAIRRTFGAAAAIQRCQVHKARNIMERLPKSLHARDGLRRQ